MQTSELLLRSPRGFKRFFSSGPARPGVPLEVRGIGLRERLPACLVERPRGTGDYLLMLFHERARASTRPGPAPLLPPDALMIWTPGQGQYYGNPDREFEHSWLHCSGVRARRILAESGLPLGRPFPAPDVARFLQCLSDIHGELVSHLDPDFRIVGNLLENCLRESARLLAPSPRTARLEEPLLAARRMIEARPEQRLTLADLARAAGMAVPTFSARFKRTFGLSPKGYLVQCRVRRAAYLLSDRDLSVSEAGAAVGYEDPFHFSKLFKKHLGTSPRAWRAQGTSTRSAFGATLNSHGR